MQRMRLLTATDQQPFLIMEAKIFISMETDFSYFRILNSTE
jgi:hypothetical protein